jgi:hypothetical protein
MNSPINTPTKTQQQDTNGTEGATQQVTIQPTRADSHRTKNLDTHLRITIRWGSPPLSYLPVTNGGWNADGPAFGRRCEAGGASC